jgi:hypothetical protein
LSAASAAVEKKPFFQTLNFSTSQQNLRYKIFFCAIQLAEMDEIQGNSERRS